MSVSPDDSTAPGSSDPLTVGEALRRWSKARDAGMTPNEPSIGGKKSISVLFVGRTNCRVSVAAQALFADLVRRRRPSVQIVSHSAGTRVELDGGAPDPAFIEALRFKRSIDISSHTSCKLSVADLESADLVVCTGAHHRIYMFLVFVQFAVFISKYSYTYLLTFSRIFRLVSRV